MHTRRVRYPSDREPWFYWWLSSFQLYLPIFPNDPLREQIDAMNIADVFGKNVTVFWIPLCRSGRQYEKCHRQQEEIMSVLRCHPDGLRFWPQISLKLYLDTRHDILRHYMPLISPECSSCIMHGRYIPCSHCRNLFPNLWGAGEENVYVNSVDRSKMIRKFLMCSMQYDSERTSACYLSIITLRGDRQGQRHYSVCVISLLLCGLG